MLRRPLLLAALLAALIWRLMGITRTEVWRDEAITILHTRAGWWDLLTRLWRVEDSPPLGFLSFKLWSIAGSDEWFMRLFPVLVGTAAVGVVVRTSERLRPGAGLPAGLLFALSPVMLHYSQEIRAYSLLMLWLALTFAAAQRLREQPNGARRAAAMSILAALAAYTHAVGLFVYPTVFAFVLITSDRRVSRQLLRPAGVWLWALLVAPLVPYLHAWSAYNAGRTDWPVPRLDAWWLQYVASSVYGWRILESWAGGSSEGAWIAFGVQRAMLVLPACAIAAGLLNPSTRRTVVGLLLAAGLGLAQFWTAQHVSVASFAERTACVVWCPIVMAIGVGYAAARGRLARILNRAGLAVTALVLGSAWIWFVYQGPARHAPSAAAFAWLSERLRSDDLIFTAPAWFEDLAVYRIGPRLPGEAYLSHSNPVYSDQPPRHRFVARHADGSWRDRLIQAAVEQRARKAPCSLWVIRYGSDSAGDESPEHLLRTVSKPGSSHTPSDPRATSIIELKLLPP